MNYPAIVMGGGFIALGIKLRKQQAKHWKAFLIGGIIIFALATLPP